MSMFLLSTTHVSNLKVLALKNGPRKVKRVQIIDQVIMRIFNEHSTLCYKQHNFSLGAIFIQEMKWDSRNPHIAHIQGRPDHDVLSHEYKKSGKNLEF